VFKWFSQSGRPSAGSRTDAEFARLERKLERLEQTIQSLANQSRKPNVTVRELHIHRPVVENVTFRLDALDIEELSGSLNLGNNFDVQFDPQSLFGGKRPAAKPAATGETRKRNDTAEARRKESASGNDARDMGRSAAEPFTSAGEADASSAATVRRTPSGLSFVMPAKPQHRP